MREFLLPKKITASQNTENAETLLVKKDMQIGLAEKNTARFSADGYIILDFGKEICGGVRILTFAANNIAVRIRFGESLSECCAELGGEKNATNDHSLRDFTVNLQNYSDMTFGQTGFRFVRLDFFGAVAVKSVFAESRILRKSPIYVYGGQDETVKKIFDAAKRTVDLCASSGYLWDGIKRDRLVWIGDMHPEMLALTTLYGRSPILERSLDFVKKQTPLPAWMNNIAMYSMWWIIILSDYFDETGCRDFVIKQLSYMKELVKLLDSTVDEKGDFEYPGYLIDWPTHETKDEIVGVRVLMILAAKKAIKILEDFGENTDYAESLLEKASRGSLAAEKQKQIIALKYLATGSLTDDEYEKLILGGAEGVSTFMSYYILNAIASRDETAAIKIMKDYYGAMLDKGATTFWEDFDISWIENSCRIDEFPKDGEKDIHGDFGKYCYKGFRHSLCHGWSAGVIKFIKEHCEVSANIIHN